MATAIKQCPQCRANFTLRSSPAVIERQKFCSRACAAASYKEVPPMLDSFRQRMAKRQAPQPNGCILYTGQNNGKYGQIEYRRRTYLAHRVAYMLAKGDIPPTMCVCHSCDTPLCINPDHLWLGTYTDNVHDMYAKGRASPVRKRKVTDEQVAEMLAAAASGRSLSSIAREYGVSSGYMTMLRKGLRRAPIPAAPGSIVPGDPQAH